MKYIAIILNNKYIDKAVYGLNKSIRLPNSYKYIQKQNRYEQRYYPVSENDYLNHVVNYTNNCIQFTDSIAITMGEFYNLITHARANYSNLKIENAIFERKSNGNVYVQCPNGYICPSNPNIFHDSNNGRIYVDDRDGIVKHIFQCYSDKCNKSKFILEQIGQNENVIEKSIKLNNIILNDLIITHNQPYISENVEFKDRYLNNNVFICSALGTGKTELIKWWIE